MRKMRKMRYTTHARAHTHTHTHTHTIYIYIYIYIYAACNKIRNKGVIALASQLPRLPALKQVTKAVYDVCWRMLLLRMLT